jgi:hypothetical protein
MPAKSASPMKASSSIISSRRRRSSAHTFLEPTTAEADP